MVGDVDREHHDERQEGEQRAPVFAQPIGPVAGHQETFVLRAPIFAPGAALQAHARATCAAPVLPRTSARMFKALLIRACSVISAPTSSRLIAPSYITSTRSQQPTSSS